MSFNTHTKQVSWRLFSELWRNILKSRGNFVLLPPMMYAAGDPRLALSSCFMLFSRYVSVTKWTVCDFGKQVKISIAKSSKVCGRRVSDCMSAFPSMMLTVFPSVTLSELSVMASTSTVPYRFWPIHHQRLPKTMELIQVKIQRAAPDWCYGVV